MPTISLIDIISASGAVLTALCWLPRALKVMRALSLPATPAFTLGLVRWLIYGFAIDDWPWIGSNAVTLVPMAPILTTKLRCG